MEEIEFYKTIIDNIGVGVYYVDNERKISFWNKEASLISGYTKDEIIGHKCQNSGLNHIDLEGRPLCALACPLTMTLNDGKVRTHHVFLKHKDGYRIPLEVKVFPVINDNIVIGAVETFKKESNKTYQDDLVNNLTKLALEDKLTKLANRRMLDTYLDYKINEFKRLKTNICLVYLDIDNFSNINNSYGHDAGDLVLQNVARSLSATASNLDLVSRYGGEEFIAIYNISNLDEARFKSDQARILVSQTETIVSDHKLKVTISAGATILNEKDDLNSIIKRADNLLYKSKANGKNQVNIDF